MPIRTSFHDRRGLPSRSKRKLPENRLHWRCSELLNPLIASSILDQASRAGLIRRSSGGRGRVVTKKQSPKVEIARERLRELERKGCDRQLILGITYLLAFGRRPETKSGRSEDRDRASALVTSLRQIALRMRHQVAFHAATTYDQRDWWLLQSLPDLLEEYKITVKKVSLALRSEPRFLRTDFWLLWLADHLRGTAGSPEWESIAAIIEGWLVNRVHQTVDGISLEKAYLKACRTKHPGRAAGEAAARAVQTPNPEAAIGNG